MRQEYKPHTRPHYETARYIEKLENEVAELGRDIRRLAELVNAYLSPEDDDAQEEALAELDLHLAKVGLYPVPTD
jgi:hypothetical protein